MLKSIQDGTYYPDNGELKPVQDVAQGYWVSYGGYETRINADAISEGLLLDVADAYRLLALEQSAFVGIWQDEGSVYFDLSEYIPDLVRAVNLGKARNQKAIWDIAAGQAIGLENHPYVYQLGKFVGISSISQKSAEQLAKGAALRAINGNGKD